MADDKLAELIPPQLFESSGGKAIYAVDLQHVETCLSQSVPDAVFMPLLLNGASTLPLLKKLKRLDPSPLIVVIAQSDQINLAAEAMHVGVFECLFQPFSQERLEYTIRSVAETLSPPMADPNALSEDPEAPQSAAAKGFKQSNFTCPPETPSRLNTNKHPDKLALSAPENSDQIRQSSHSTNDAEFDPAPSWRLVGENSQMQSILQVLKDVAASMAPVLLHGEIGTGKEHCARHIHENSGRDQDQFVVIDCASLTPDKFSNLISGHSNWGRTETTQSKPGTIYLDEIANLIPSVQSQFVQYIRSGNLHQVKAGDPQSEDNRIISATSRDPKPLSCGGEVLDELFFQLHVVPVALPPLRDRKEDISALALQFLEDCAKAEQRKFECISPEALERLHRHSWPGNVLELKCAIWNSVLCHDGKTLTADMLPSYIQTPSSTAPHHAQPDKGLGNLVGRSFAEIEQLVIEETIRTHGGSIPKAANTLGLSPSTIYRKREIWNN
ncbi:sigma 54-interacting transcriptional regulator [Aliiroseovarius sp. KMU-50]|uniref:Sigma 54-interacting transcriptional regulator n=1 Tax=Aliiroseovarius salicola TaxID=3009082 RepID=A0ABT4W544_9RHOB|nr:sigma 54-interacting transcriptional regulator [Aliiroseovarius sp. KMU-50]MDA5095641.1 sigma 54-interacting transcriptional regulator [Aliiroseovarius sp. KMU-50]